MIQDSGQETGFAATEQIITRLTSQRDRWARLSAQQRIPYLKQCIADLQSVAAEWSTAACQAKGIDPQSALAGEEWLIGPVSLMHGLRLFIETLAAGGQPRPPRLQQRDNQIIAQVLPSNLWDQLLWPGFRAEVWLQPGKPAYQGKIYREPEQTGRLALVLGAGNVSSIGPLDALHFLLVENCVVLLKTNPVNAYLGQFWQQALRSLIAAGFLAIVSGGADFGQWLCQHPQIETIHLTGSQATHDAIVWGRDSEQAEARRAQQTPLLTKPITSELGCVTPILVVPGPWSQADLAFQARQVAAMVAHNASFNCAAGQVLVTAAGWPQQSVFLAQVRSALAAIPVRQAYYPDAIQRYQEFCRRYPQSIALVAASTGEVPWTVIPDVPPQPNEYALRQEAFCGLLAEVSLTASIAPDFLQQAVALANEVIWGTLSCTLLIHPYTQQQYRQEFQDAISQLRYGTIGINAWSGVSYSLGSTTWGAFPGHCLSDIQSGQGVVHNTYLFDYPQKSVLYAPFRIRPTPAWFADHPNLLNLAQQLLAFEAQPNGWHFLKLLAASLS